MDSAAAVLWLAALVLGALGWRGSTSVKAAVGIALDAAAVVAYMLLTGA